MSVVHVKSILPHDLRSCWAAFFSIVLILTPIICTETSTSIFPRSKNVIDMRNTIRCVGAVVVTLSGVRFFSYCTRFDFSVWWRDLAPPVERNDDVLCCLLSAFILCLCVGNCAHEPCARWMSMTMPLTRLGLARSNTLHVVKLASRVFNCDAVSCMWSFCDFIHSAVSACSRVVWTWCNVQHMPSHSITILYTCGSCPL